MVKDVVEPEKRPLSYKETIQTHLFTPLKLRDLSLKHRIVVSPMCQYSCDQLDGIAHDWHLVHLGAMATGKAALVFTEAAAVEARGRISPADLGIWNDQQIEPLARINRFITSQGSIPGIQLAHAGRKASTSAPWNGGKYVQEGGWEVVAPSAVPFADGYGMPHELNIQEIQEISNAFARSAQRSLDAGYQVIELHAAHGYLMHQFLSPYSNKRTDAYGGSFENRIRFVLETVRAVRKVWPERLPLFIRVSATDWLQDQPEIASWDSDQTVELARILRNEGVDMLDCSSGGNVASAKIPLGPGYQVPFAARVRNEAGMPAAAVGMITNPQQADQIIRTGQADLVLLAREELRDPHFPLRAAHELGQEIEWPIQYTRAAW
jgi:2,4-dienoyl-CoA reductase-like NADH-dependent reductase (Old Yellow Enzyme family)